MPLVAIYPGGTILPGVVPDGELPTGACRQDADCKSADLMCSATATTTMCSCLNGEDVCVQVPKCVQTPCKVCADCVRDYQAFVASVQGISSAEQVAARFMAKCLTTRTSQACAPVGAAVNSSTNGNMGKRASMLCTSLGDCPQSSVALVDSCVINVITSTGVTMQGQRSQCTAEGLVNGSTLPGIAATSGGVAIRT